MLHDSRLKAPTPPTDPQRMGALTTILKLIGGVVVLNVIAAYNPTLALVLAASVIVAAAAVFLFTLLRKD